MASIWLRSGKWQARVIRKGFPDEARTFTTKAEAAIWARSVEVDMERGHCKAAGEADEERLTDLLDRYRKEATPSKREALTEAIRINAIRRR